MSSIPGLPSSGSNVCVLITRVNVNPLCVLVEFWGNFDQDLRHAYQRIKKEIQYPGKIFQDKDGKPGDLCLVQVYETWYRARIVSRNDSGYSVFLIDEGRTLNATTSTLAWGQTDFFYLPPEVEFCVLSNVLPVSPENKWSTMALEFMKTFCGRTVTAGVQDVLVPQRTFLLDIPFLSRQMCEMGFANKLSNERFKDFVSRSLQSHNSFIEPQRIPPMRNEPVKHTERQQCYLYPELQTETVETVIVTEVTNPLRVFCQLKVFSQELRKLMGQITQHYEGRIGASFARPENLGAPCASRGADGKWYRSVLQQVMFSSNMAEVLHVDYGKKQFVSVEHVRPLVSEFFRMPVVTYVCSLHGVFDQGIGWTASQIDYLRSLILNRTVIAKFEYYSLSEGVHYVTLYGDEKTNINNLFGLREKCLLDPVSRRDTDTVAFFKSGSSEACQISFKGDAQGTDKSKDLKGTTPVFCTESLPLNTAHVAVVQHVDSPSKFWIQTQRYAVEFDQLMKSLEELYGSSTSASEFIKKPVAGLLCVARSQDVFYRAVICEVIETKADVFFLDYGNREFVDFSELRVLPVGYQKLPALAVKCALYGIQAKHENWNQKATLFFSRAVEDKILNVDVLAKSQNTHFVKVIDSFSEGEKDLSKLLCSRGFADSETAKVVDEPVKQYTEVIQTDEVKTNAHSQSSTSPAFKEYLFPIGSSLDVTVSYIENLNDFWCQKANDAQCLKQLMQELQNYYKNSEFQSPLEAACVARHPENGLWYRALLIQKHNHTVTVLFVDYGETKKVAIHDIRHINPAFLKLKGQAFRCRLYNFHPVSHSTLEWSPGATALFQEFVDNASSLNIVLKCTVYAVMYDSQKVVFNVVDLETPFQSICRLLVQKGLADQAPSKKAQMSPFRLDTYFYSTHDIKTGSEEDVSITSAEDVNHFFCHLERNYAQVNMLAEKVNSLCRQLETIECPKSFGKVCFAKYTDGFWYRGLIKSTKPSVAVYFVDYGNTKNVEKSDLLPVPIEAGDIMSVPVQAVECGLSDMPVDMVPSKVNDWFESFVTDRCLTALIVAKEPCGKLIVELYDGKTQVNAMIREKFHTELKRNEQVIAKEFYFRNQTAPCNVFESPKQRNGNGENQLRQMRGRKEPHGPLEPWRSLKSAGLKQAENRGTSHDSVMKKEMTQRKPNCHGSHGECQSESENKSHGFEKPGLLKQVNLPVKVIKPGLKAEVLVSHCNNPLSFCVQLLTDESNVCSLVMKLNDDKSKRIPVKPDDLHEGELVSAVFPDNDCWYRAIVGKAPVNDIVDVEFIDFGNTAKVSVSKMCVLDRTFSHPRYSIHCSLTGVQHVDNEMTSAFKKEIEKHDNKITCTFIQQSGSVWQVKLEANGELLDLPSSKNTDAITESSAPESTVIAQSPDLVTSNLDRYFKNPDLSEGQVISVYASFISGPQLFWCQTAETDELEKISEVIQKAGNDLETAVLKENPLPFGSGCIALFADDQLWYRAKVTSRDDNSLSVLFVDYGNESKVQMSDVRPLPPEVADVTPLAFACQLDGFDTSKGSWNDDAADQFFELINDKLLKVTVLKLGSLGDLGKPHFVKLECVELVINDAIKYCWNSERTSFELSTVPPLTYPETESSICVTESALSPMEQLQVATDYEHSDACDIAPQMLSEPEQEGTVADLEKQANSVVILDESEVFIDVVSLQDESSELVKMGDTVVEEPLPTENGSDWNQTSAEIYDFENCEQNVPKDSDIHADVADSCENNPDVLEEGQLDVTDFGSKEAYAGSQSTHLDVPENLEPSELNRPFEADCLILDYTDEKSECLSSREDAEKVCECTQLYSSVSDFEENVEVIKSGLGLLRCAAGRTSVGSECVIWSDAHKNWCKARTLKVSEDSALVLLLDYDSMMMIDPASIFEIIPEELLQVPCSAETGILTGKVKEVLEPQNQELDSCFDNVLQPFQQPELANDPGQTLTSSVENMAQTEDDEETCNPAAKQTDYVCQPSEQADELMCLIPALKLEKSQNVEPEAEPNLGRLIEMPQEKAQCVEPETDSDLAALVEISQEEARSLDPDKPDVEALLEEVNSFTEDVTDVTSDADQQSDTASDDTLQEETMATEHAAMTDSSVLCVEPTVFEHPDTDVLEVTHLILKINEASDDVVFVKAWTASPAEPADPGSEE
ncbi:tudor domain-containing 6 isoform X2 [Trichomycterus rosablanca]|uniref:tudor domain-containing 6 isoform X2 n=1 Tax=Trichomycterus rosablanca TaxID=2290929 RepID=UPI002F359EA9